MPVPLWRNRGLKRGAPGSASACAALNATRFDASTTNRSKVKRGSSGGRSAAVTRVAAAGAAVGDAVTTAAGSATGDSADSVCTPGARVSIATVRTVGSCDRNSSSSRSA